MKKILLIPLFFLTSMLYSQTLPTEPTSFGGGVDFSVNCNDVDPRRACDGSNMQADQDKSVFPRNGTKRFISQAFSSTNPISSLYYYHVSTGNTTRSGIIAINGTNILRSTSIDIDDKGARWDLLFSSLATPNQKFSFVTVDPNVIFTGDALTDPVFKFNVMTSSLAPLLNADASTVTINIRAKFVTANRNYLILLNVLDIKDVSVSTYYPSRFYYSRVLEISSFTSQRFEDIGIENGEITGVSTKLGKVQIYQPRTINELTFTVLDVGGDQDFIPIVDGFGIIAPKTLDDLGLYDMGLSYEGIFLWDGGRRTIVDVKTQKDIVSNRIRSIIQKLVNKGKYQNSVGKFFPKLNSYIFCYEDSDKFPQGANNSCMSFDFNIGEWFPIDGWNVASMESIEPFNGSAKFVYGDSKDSYVYYIDQKGFDDARKELSLDTMDSTVAWVNSSTSTVGRVEGLGAVRLLMTPSVLSSSITRMGILNMGEWHDKTRVTKKDKLQFKVYASSAYNITDFRIDLLVEDAETAFTTNFSSIVISTNSLVSGNTVWSTFEVDLGSFPVAPEWTDLSIESFPFSGGFTYYGIRFVATGTANSALTFDDLRIIQKNQNPINPFWLMPPIKVAAATKNEYRELIFTRDKPSDTSIKIDVFADYGQLVKTLESKADVPKTIHLLKYNGNGGIYELDSNDFYLIRSSALTNPVEREITEGVADKEFLYLNDFAMDQILIVKRGSFTVVVSSFGSLGTGTTNQDQISQISLDDSGLLWMTDSANTRVKVNQKKDLKIVKIFGELGDNTTNFSYPTGIASDSLIFWVHDDGASKVKKFSKDKNTIVNEFPLDLNTSGEGSLAVDSKFLYVAYNKLNEQNLFFQDVVLEKRLKSDGSLVNRVFVRPEGSVRNSTSALAGNIAIQGDFIYISFTDDVFSGTGKYYLQKRLKDDFSIVRELVSDGEQFGVIGYGLEFLPSEKAEKIPIEAGDSINIQFRYYGEGLNNRFRLINQGVSVNQKTYQEGN